jgi:hypothetical protein
VNKMKNAVIKEEEDRIAFNRKFVHDKGMQGRE